MARSQVLDLDRAKAWDLEDPNPSVVPPQEFWPMVLLLALKDGADLICLTTREGTPKLGYRVDGVVHELMPPPAAYAAAMVEEARDLSRPRGWRARLIRVLRSLIHRLEGGPLLSHRPGFYAKLGENVFDVETSPEGEEGIVLRLLARSDLAGRANDMLRRMFDRQIP